MTLAAIHCEIEKMLADNGKKVMQRRKAIEALRNGLAKRKNQLFPMLRRREAWFSTDQTGTKNAKGHVKVQMLGIDVGELSLKGTSQNPSYWFYPREERLGRSSGFSNGPWRWSKHAKDGNEIRSFLKECGNIPAANAKHEREIQWQLANALRSTKKVDALRQLRPVTWNGCFTEIGISINEPGEPNTGTIDLLVRRGKGAQRGFLVFELKKPGVTDVESALKQALRYATALNIEANEGDPENLKNYHAAFGSKGTGTLKIGAVIVLQDSSKVRTNAAAFLQKYWAERGGTKLDRIGALLYSLDANNRPNSWNWLEGWDAREAPRS